MTKISVVYDTVQAADACNATRWARLRWDFDRLASVARKYLQVAKPGIVLGNLISVIGGFLLASRGHVAPELFIAAITGVSLVVASGCAFNNYIDRDIDIKMRRTQKRVLALGLVSPVAVLTYGSLLGLAGFFLLYRINILSALLAMAGFVVYVGLYSLLMKRRSVFATLVGSLSGAMPPVIGYCSVTNQFDLGAAFILLTFSLWQMPHSYAIAMVYRDDYAAAAIPVLPVKSGMRTARIHTLLYIPVFTAAALMLSVYGYTGPVYAVVMAAMGLGWLGMGLFGYRAAGDRIWARKMFIYSIIIIMILSLLMAVDFRVPHPYASLPHLF